METCVFCKIIKGDIPCYKVYENENFLSFLDIRPLNKGHTLIIPKKHYRWVWDIEEEYSQTVNQIANAIKKALGTDYVQSVVMGDEVHHAHIHLVPRFDNDGHGPVPTLAGVKEISEDEMKETAQKIASFL